MRLAQSDGTTTRYFQYDALDSVRQLTDGTGTPKLTQTFDPYGNLYAKAGSVTIPANLGFTGDSTEGNNLVFLRARYYNPAQGRFMQMAPSRAEANLYGYANGNPLSYVDPRHGDINLVAHQVLDRLMYGEQAISLANLREGYYSKCRW